MTHNASAVQTSVFESRVSSQAVQFGSTVKYRVLTSGELCRGLFSNFVRHQTVTKCWRREAGRWVIRDDPFIDDWSEADYQRLVACLKNTAMTGGFIFGAFISGKLKGFVSVESAFIGPGQNYMDLSSIHVSEDVRGKGIGTTLFQAAQAWAREKGAEKLYISSHSAVETQAFYRRLGCVDAQIYDSRHVEAEPFDCQLEYVL